MSAPENKSTSKPATPPTINVTGLEAIDPRTLRALEECMLRGVKMWRYSVSTRETLIAFGKAFGDEARRRDPRFAAMEALERRRQKEQGQ